MGLNHRLGEAGESIALTFLLACGYRLLDRRYRRPGGEIDLVLLRGDLLVFVEVKARGPGSPAPAEYWLGARQLRCLRRLAGRWLAEHPAVRARGCRFDLVAVDFAGEEEGLRLRHLPDIL